MRIAFVCGEYPPSIHGGIGSMTRTLGRALAAAGHDVRVAGCYGEMESVRHEVDHGVEVWRLPMTKGPLGWIDSRRRLFRLIASWVREGSIDLVEVPDWQGWAAGWPRLAAPVVSRLNGSATYFAAEMDRRASLITRSVEGASLRRADFIASVSRYTAARTVALFTLGRQPDVVLPNPVTLDAHAPWAQREPRTVVFSGTLTEKKGVIPLIDAWPRVLAQCPGAHLHLLGKDGLSPDGRSMTAFLKARLPAATAAHVSFHGHVSRESVASSLARARVAVFPSFSEALAIAPLEAMSAGCPTISSALGSGPELMDDGVDGITADPRRPESIAAALIRVLADETLARQLGDNGRARVMDRMSIDRLRPANEAFFDACIARHRARLARELAGAAADGVVQTS
ncbi:MAG: glycosyltransferase family 4 protein [Acidobacteria bacterium]|nr:glycosyltransferase family 4 protein [Acidobacteriota bacterium]